LLPAIKSDAAATGFGGRPGVSSRFGAKPAAANASLVEQFSPREEMSKIISNKMGS
jgi:hypothetical protein